MEESKPTQEKETALETLQGHLACKQLRIDLMKAKGVTNKNLAEIADSYLDCCEFAQKHHLNMDILFSYGEFLYHQGEYRIAISCVKWLDNYYLLFPAGLRSRGLVKNLLGILYYKTGQLDKGEDNCRTAIELLSKNLATEKNAYLSLELAQMCNNFANLLSEQDKLQEAYKLSEKGIDLYYQLSLDNPDILKTTDFAHFCSNFAGLLDRSGQHQDADTLYHLVQIQMEHIRWDDESELNVQVRATNLANYAQHLLQQNHLASAKTFCDWGIYDLESLSKENPTAYYGILASTYDTMAKILHQEGKLGDAKEFYQKAIELFELLTDKNPYAYADKLSACRDGLSSLAIDRKKQDSPKKNNGFGIDKFTSTNPLLAKAESLLRRFDDYFFPDDDPDDFDIDLDEIYSDNPLYVKISSLLRRWDELDHKALDLLSRTTGIMDPLEDPLEDSLEDECEEPKEVQKKPAPATNCFKLPNFIAALNPSDDL